MTQREHDEIEAMLISLQKMRDVRLAQWNALSAQAQHMQAGRRKRRFIDFLNDVSQALIGALSA